MEIKKENKRNQAKDEKRGKIVKQKLIKLLAR